jgi:DUF1365 family protein
MSSSLIEGRVWHRRRRPRDHSLAYGVFMLLLDLGALETLNERLRLFSANRFNLLDFRARDHLSGRGGDLRLEVGEILAAEGLPAPARIRLLCAVFNPLSVFFCEDAEGVLSCVLYEVNNTFGQRHAYLLPAAAGRDEPQTCAKTFYVSPFNGLDMRYEFRLDVHKALRGEGPLMVRVDVIGADGPLLAAAFTGTPAPLTDRTIFAAALRHPLLAAKVLGAIHWEALKLWLKGVRLVPRPPAPERFVTVPGSEPGIRR